MSNIDLWQPNKTDFVHARNNVMMRILLRNGQRAGAILNATMEQYAACLKQGDVHLLIVSNSFTLRS
jgi:hypothetical protein